ncbi:hypothetical protein HNP02_007130 [Mycobacterium sp. AZCC_0083]|nr:hypothetical protein [Mycobacterium sp. AZCC_0083]
MSVAVIALLSLILGVGVASVAAMGIVIFIVNDVKEQLESSFPVIPTSPEIGCETT